MEIALAPGDAFVFYTDGVVEARARREEYGEERLLRGIERHADRPARELGERCCATSTSSSTANSPADDVTLVVIKML